MAAPKGNSNAKKGRRWAEAITEALLEYKDDEIKQGEALRAIGKKLVKKALEGDKDAMKEIGDRLDGKPSQAITGEDGGALVININRG
mgnify:CR=1 FL=1